MTRATHTHTYAALEVSAAAYDEIAAKLRAAEYHHAFDTEEGVIDMNGLALLRAEPTTGDADERTHPRTPDEP